MSARNRPLRLLSALFAAANLVASFAPRASAADGTPAIPRSQNVTINLIRRLVERGVLPRADADELIAMAEADAAEAKTEAAAKASVPTPPPTVAAATPARDDTIRVTYVPEIVKRQIREELKQEVMTQAREERWATPRSFPEWASRFTLFGDFRLREEMLFYPAGSDNTGAFPNFNAINTGAPFDVAGTVFSPQNNVDRDRQRLRVRARFGAEVDMGENYAAGARLATGENTSPVTTNQSFGAANGNFSKYAIWLDRIFVNYRARLAGLGDASIHVGRFDSPFFASQMIFDEDLGFDGLALQSKRPVNEQVKAFATLGAFPVFNSNLNFPSIQPAKFKSQDKWLFGGQIGADYALSRDLNAKVGAAYYYFNNVEGKLSRPFTPVNAQDSGDTDETRPSFAQTGNTYFPLRNIVPGVLNNFGTTNQFQYFGLATPYREVALTGRLDYDGFEPTRISLVGEWVNNLAFHRGSIRRKAVNNLGARGAGDFVGGNNGWNLDVKIGSAALTQRWDWNASLGYRRLDSDAVVDALTDSDFGNGGTNLEGYTLAGSLALSRRTWLTVRWYSTTSIAGPRYKNDIFQFDFNGKF